MAFVNSNSDGLPLKDINVVSTCQVIAGPFATQTLGDLGANVVKIEAVNRGDRARSLDPVPQYFDTLNRNKESIAINLKTDRGQEITHRLLEEADVFVESMKPGRTERFDLDYQTVKGVTRDIIYCSISGFGNDSPYENLPAWDMLIQAMSGVMSMTGEPDGRPVWSGLPSGDLAASMYATQSILAALYAREQGIIDGEYIEIPMLDAAISWLTARAGYTFGNEQPFPRTGDHHPSIAPFGIFNCADGWLIVAAGTQSLWEELCHAIERPELLADGRFETSADRVQNVEDLKAELDAVFNERTQEEWLEILHKRNVPAGRINDTLSIWEDEHVQTRGLRCSMERAEQQDASVINHPVIFKNLDTHLSSPPPQLGANTHDILNAVGYTQGEIESLRREGVID